MEELYPLKFEPILKEKVWGGNKLKTLLNRNTNGNIGESWDISGVDGSISKVKNGFLKGVSLVSLVVDYKEKLVGKKIFERFGTNFPLLFKFIDAAQDLSVQLHPGDALAKQRHNSFGKTEMWYIIDAEEDSNLILGFNKKMTEDTYLKSISDNNITKVLHSEKAIKGDAFFIKPGTVHSIGAGILLAEIQQTSDVTYRIYDWDRLDGDNLRELHNDIALEAIDFGSTKSKLNYKKDKNEVSNLVSNPYFETNILNLTLDKDRSLKSIDSFVVYMCVAGNAEIKAKDFSEKIEFGETILIPASISEIEIKTLGATLLEVYIP